jgi:hypothetical protein
MYTYVWSKYRPAVLKLMVDADGGQQQYKFSPHEFIRINPKEKGGHRFTLRVFQGQAVNNIRETPVAQDLLFILQQSKKALELADASAYEFVLDKHFVLNVTRITDTPEPIVNLPDGSN